MEGFEKTDKDMSENKPITPDKEKKKSDKLYQFLIWSLLLVFVLAIVIDDWTVWSWVYELDPDAPEPTLEEFLKFLF